MSDDDNCITDCDLTCTSREMNENKCITLNFDIFKEKVVSKFFEEKFQHKIYLNEVAEDVDHDVQDEYFKADATSSLICRLCTKPSESFLHLYDEDGELLPIGQKISSLIGKNKVKQDLLPQQVCPECSVNVMKCYTSIEMFNLSHQVLSEAFESFKKEVYNEKDKLPSLILVGEKYYDVEDMDVVLSLCQVVSSDTDQKPVDPITAEYVCSVCHKEFKSYEMLKEHETLHEVCLTCDLLFLTPQELSEHIRIHHINTPIIERVDKKSLVGDEIIEEEMMEQTEDDPDNQTLTKFSSQKEKIKRKKPVKIKDIKSRAISEIMRSPVLMLKTCSFCEKVFPNDIPEETIENHVAYHFYIGKVKVDMDEENVNVADHVTVMTCYMCTYCNKPWLEKKVKDHLNTCQSFAEQYGLARVSLGRKRVRKQSSKFRCEQCKDDFVDTTSLYKHVQTSHADSLPSCAMCSKTFTTKFQLRSHVRQVHLKNNRKDDEWQSAFSVMCEFCSKVCRNRKAYNQHKRVVHLGHKYKTQKKKKNEKKVEKKPRFKIDHKSLQYLECDICDRTIRSWGLLGLEFHQAKHGVPDGKVKCCNKILHSLKAFSEHVQAHNSVWTCGTCENQMSSFLSFEDHMCSVHGHTNMQCSFCEAHFFDRKLFYQHFIRCSNQEEVIINDPYFCCGTKLKNAESLRKHVARHVDTPCKKCDAVLKSKIDLQAHVLAVHVADQFMCHYCDKAMQNASSLKYHMLHHTQGKNVKCDCGLRFYTVNDLQKHQSRNSEPCVGKVLKVTKEETTNQMEVDLSANTEVINIKDKTDMTFPEGAKFDWSLLKGKEMENDEIVGHAVINSEGIICKFIPRVKQVGESQKVNKNILQAQGSNKQEGVSYFGSKVQTYPRETNETSHSDQTSK